MGQIPNQLSPQNPSVLITIALNAGKCEQGG